MAKLKFGVELPQHLGFEYLKEMAQTIEKLGYDSIWIRDHLTVSPFEMTRFQQGYIKNGKRVVSGNYLGCIPTMAAAAAVTKRVLIGTDILNIPRRNPIDIANEFATIDQISNGRVILQGAIGQPTRDWASSGVRHPYEERGKMMEEAIAVIKQVWTHDEPTDFKGKYYNIEGARIGSKPVQKPHPPIWLGVGKTFKRVARIADGFTLSHSMFGGKFEEYKAGLDKINAEAKAIGRNPKKIEAAARFALTLGADVEATKKRGAAHWGALWSESQPWHTEWAGDADHVIKVMTPWLKAGVTHIMLWPIAYAPTEKGRFQDIEYFAKKVIPRLRK